MIGRDPKLPPSIINLTVPLVLHVKPLLQLTRLQRLNLDNPNILEAGDLAEIAHCLTQLTHMDVGDLHVEDEAAPQVISALAALPLKKLGVLSYGPQQPGAAAGAPSPAAVGALLGQLTGLTSLTLWAGAYAWRDVAASLARLTDLQDLMLFVHDDGDDDEDGDRPRSGVIGDAADAESFVDTLAGLEKLSHLIAYDSWFGSGDAAVDLPHPIMRLQAATQLDFLEITFIGPKPGITKADFVALKNSLPGVNMGPGFAALDEGAAAKE
uniref:FBD domain-containing protein n=1 Tax=Tetradesmus obliquus TaxID=3088 RepID=A0A383WPY0_TETOB|eukprot:jgi/Sobl393_1/4612/SZX79239.1